MTYPLIELGGDDPSPPLHIALANGFVPETYFPVLKHFMDDYRVVCLPPRALWDDALSPPPVTPESDWNQLADDLLAGIEKHNLQKIVAVGHSFGGVATLLAALKQPDYFKALIMLDPTLLPPMICDGMKMMRETGTTDQHPMVQKANRRLNEFESIDDAFDRFRDKRLFSDWSDDVLRLYVEYGTVQQGDKRVLRWSPQWESYYYATGYSETWRYLVPALSDLDVPMLFIAGGKSDTYTAESAANVAEAVPQATHQSIEGYGHLFPQAAPHATATMIRDWLTSL